MDYDNLKLSSPYDECTEEYVKVDVEVEIFTSKINFEDDCTSLTTTITVDAVLTCDDFEEECYVEEEDVKNAVDEYLGKGCEYEIIDWRRA